MEIYLKSPKRDQEMYFITLQYCQASVKSSRPLVSSFQCRCLSLPTTCLLSPDFSIIQHSSRGSQAIYPLCGPQSSTLSSGSCILRAKFPKSNTSGAPSPAGSLTRRRQSSPRWLRLAREGRVDDRRGRDGVR